jgi:hypothetical protein
MGTKAVLALRLVPVLFEGKIYQGAEDGSLTCIDNIAPGVVSISVVGQSFNSPSCIDVRFAQVRKEPRCDDDEVSISGDDDDDVTVENFREEFSDVDESSLCSGQYTDALVASGWQTVTKGFRPSAVSLNTAAEGYNVENSFDAFRTVDACDDDNDASIDGDDHVHTRVPTVHKPTRAKRQENPVKQRKGPAGATQPKGPAGTTQSRANQPTFQPTFPNFSESAATPVSFLPKRLNIGPKTVKRLHLRGHRDAESIFQFLKDALTKSEKEKFIEELKVLKQFCVDVVKKCVDCQKHRSSTHKQTQLTRKKPFNFRIWIDIVHLEGNVHAVGVIEDSISEIAIQPIADMTSATVIHAIESRWTSIRGIPKFIVSDGARNLMSQDYVDYFSKQGVCIEQTPSYSSDSHGKIERVFRTLRWGLDRLVKPENPRSLKDWETVCFDIENSMRNVVTQGGFSPSQRATGRGSSNTVYISDSTPATLNENFDDASEVTRLLKLREEASEAFTQMRTSRALRKILSERIRPVNRDFKLGEVVYFSRPVTGAASTMKRAWKGPAVVASIVNSVSGGSVKYIVNYGGNSVSVGSSDIRGINDVHGLGDVEAVLDPPVPKENVVDRSDLKLREPLDESEEQPLRILRKVEENVGVDVEEKVGVEVGEVKEKVGVDVVAPPPISLSEIESAIANIKNAMPKRGRPKGSKNKGLTKAQVRAQVRALTKSESVSKWAKEAHGRYSNGKDGVEIPKVESINLLRNKIENGMDLGVQSRTNACLVVALNDDDDDFDDEASVDDDISDDDESSNTRNWAVRDVFTNYDEDDVSTCASDDENDAVDNFCFKAYDGDRELKWKDVPEKERDLALEKAVADYSESCVGPGLTARQVRAKHPGATLMRGHMVKTPKHEGEGAATRLIGRARWTPHGYMEETEYDEFGGVKGVDSPTPTQASLRMLMLRGLRRGDRMFKFDIKSAFFSSEKRQDDRIPLFMQLPPEDPRCIPGTTTYRELSRDIPGTRRGPRSFYETLVKVLIKNGFAVSSSDPCIFSLRNKTGDLEAELAIHVDDGLGFCSNAKAETKVRKILEQSFALTWTSLARGEKTIFLGYEISENDDGLRLSQDAFCKAKLKEVDTCKKSHNTLITEEQRSKMRKLIGCLRWVHRIDMTIGYVLSRSSSWVASPHCRVQHLNDLNKIVRRCLRDLPFMLIPRLDADLPLHEVGVCDAGEPPEDEIFRGRWQSSFVVLVGERYDHTVAYVPGQDPLLQKRMCPIIWHFGLTRRVSSSSFDGETLTAVECADACLAVQAHLEESLTGDVETLLDRRRRDLKTVASPRTGMKTVTLDIDTDCNDLVTGVVNLVPLKGWSKRRKTDIFDFKELIDLKYLRRIRKIKGPTNPVDACSKRVTWNSVTMKRLVELNRFGRYTSD